MTQNTRLEILSAEAQRFPQPPPEATAELEDVRSAARKLASTLTSSPDARASRYFNRRWKALRTTLQSLLAEVQASAQLTVSDEFRWLQENTRILNAALHDTAELVKSRKCPHVCTRGGATVPRLIALAEGYLNAVEYRFDSQSLAAFIDAFQEATVLNVREVWALALGIKLVLLEEATACGLRLLRDLAAIGSVSDCIRSLHHVGQTSWREVLEPLIVVDRLLRGDPAGAYPAMDFESRERYWEAVINIAAHSDLREIDVAIEALSLAREPMHTAETDTSDPRLTARRAHVGYYLLAEGVPVLQRRAGFRPPFGQRIVSLLRRYPNAYYLGGISLLTLVMMAAALVAIFGTASGAAPLLLAAIALLLPCTQTAVEVMNCLTTSLLPVQFIPKLDFSEGIPDHCFSMVAVPALLLHEAQVRGLVDNLEVRYLGNRDRNLHFALLTDLPDSEEPPREDDPLVSLCAELIEKLNEKYARRGRGSFLLLHRHRVYNPREGVWMGWERKRGKLMDFYSILRQQYDAFPVKVGDLSLLPRVRFVITLDADTELPRASAQRMIGALAHPLNQAIIDPQRNVVVAGYGILQPRVGVSVRSAARSRLAYIY